MYTHINIHFKIKFYIMDLPQLPWKRSLILRCCVQLAARRWQALE